MFWRGIHWYIIHSSLVEAKLSQAEAMETVAKAQNKKVDSGTRVELLNSAYDMWQQAQAGLTIAKKTYERMQSLYKKGVVSEQKRDEAEAAYKAMVATESAAKSQYEMAKAGAQAEDKAAAPLWSPPHKVVSQRSSLFCRILI